ncbi:MAG: germination protein YpeB [Firmicutes bacterium]|nr:germination protein YpeB [Bacillota bacterium]
MRRTWPTMLVSLLLIAGVGYWGYTQYLARQRMEILLSNQYQQSFYQLISAVESAQVTAAKSLVSGSPRENIVNLSELWRQAEIAKQNLDNLPISHPVLSRTSTFLTQLADYGYSLAKQNADGRPTTNEQWEKLAELRDEASYLSAELHKAHDETINGAGFRWSEVIPSARNRVQNISAQGLGVHFDRIDKQMVEYPTIIYDGPFSDHVTNARPKGIDGEEVSEDEAVNAVRRFLATAGSDQVNIDVQGKIDGRIPTYHVMVQPQGNARNMRADLTVSRQGGKVVTMLNSRRPGQATIDLNRAEELAKEFLVQQGFGNMVPSYRLNQEGAAVIIFVAKENEVIIYPDQIKVKVSLDNGEIIGFDATQYYMNHQQRRLPEPKISAEEAKRLVNPRLQVENVRLALIPLPTLAEVLCWEVRCKFNEETYLVYLEAQTGEEEQILQVVDAEEGTLVI